MRRRVLLLAPVLAALVVASGVALAATKVGTRGNDRLVGTDNNDVLKGKAGNDRLFGKGGDDLLNGGSGRDRLHDDANPDETDSFSCGSGRDAVWANPNDTVPASCEVKNVAGGGGEEAQDLLPDLGMARIANIQIQNTARQKLLRFGTKIVNVGAGDFQAHGERSSTAQATMTDVEQRIFDSAGGHHDVQATGAEMYYSGDGHDHWHVRNLEVYILTRLSDAGEPVGEPVAKGNKQGFCFYDNVEWGSSKPAFYGTDTSPYGVGCSNGQPGALDVTVGLSRGWGDNYSWNTVGQSVTITGLPDGTYRLTATADPDNWFVESVNANNDTWVDIRIAGNTVNVLGYGPSSPQVSG